MSLRFFLDEDLSDRVAAGLRQRGIDATSVHEVGRNGLEDEEQLQFATDEGRVLVTCNRVDFQPIDAQWYAQGRLHGGILWVADRSIPRQAYGVLIDALEAVAHRYLSLSGLCLPLERSRAKDGEGTDASL